MLPTRASSARSARATGCSRHAAAACAAALLLVACAGYGPGNLRPGQGEADVVASMGQPTDRTVLPGGGSRLDYARGPFGKHTYRLELDAAGRVTSISQLLVENNFESLRPGMSRIEVRDRLGRPSETRVGWRGVGEVWSYRYEYERFGALCRWFQVWLVDDRVREAAYAEDPQCEERRPFIGDKD
jgi:hypothetical protein